MRNPDNATHEAMARLRANPDWNKVMNFIEGQIDEHVGALAVATDLVFIHRLQGRIGELRDFVSLVSTAGDRRA